ncbi:hypothetical protein [uncultured Draconibacterium sp.]|uniref:hypothetical protein n=1 Tax=uncultured Draconibacterium sp. TaxID=1573823 RepID=UPI0029C00260|nr:hypothetical protein [uncultured Draconibacterium sp.]
MMKSTTVNSMNFLALKDNDRMGLRIPSAMKTQIEQASDKAGIKPAKYVKLAIIEKLDREDI